MEHYFLDGTKIEANANRYTFVWGKAVIKHKAKLQEKVQTLLATIEEAQKQEDQEFIGNGKGRNRQASLIIKSIVQMSASIKCARIPLN
ncbi:hypothetical protein PMSD_07550 [Paenibacillus macquariensis subsp. defensor]|nr:hypothetical protein PMSD_07550 [Paenibacillus macquariensis subsp. defensor]